MTNTTAPEGSIDAAVEMLMNSADVENQDVAEDDATEAPVDEPTEVEELSAEDPDDVDGDDDTGAEDEEAELADEGDGDEQPAQEFFTVKVDGEEQQVTLDDLKRSYSGQAYIQKGMEEASRQKKEVEGIYMALQDERQKLANFLQQMQTEGVPQMPEKPSKELLNSDPIAYFEQMEAYREGFDQYQQFQQQQESFARQQSEAQARAQQAYLAEQAQRLAQVVPEFADPEKAKAIKADLVQTAVDAYGYSEAELSQVMDARAVQVLVDAMKYRKLQQGKSKAVEKTRQARPVVKPGVKRSDADGKAAKRKKAAARMKRDGSIDAAVQFLLS